MWYSGITARADQNIDQSNDKGPFYIIGDVHGCIHELITLLEKDGWRIKYDRNSDSGFSVEQKPDRKLVFVGDLVDRGPDSLGVVKLAMHLWEYGFAYCIPGNHDEKFMRYLMGRKVQLKHGLEKTVGQFKGESGHFKNAVKNFFQSLPSYLILDEGKLVISHAGIKKEMIGRSSKDIREYTLYGESTGNYDEFGLPERVNWTKSYNGKALVVYGHTAVEDVLFQNNTVAVDTGCVFGGKLSALKYPEMEVISVKAFKDYVVKNRPFGFS